MKKKLKWLIPACLVTVLAVSFFIYAGIYYHADGSAVKALAPNKTVSVTETDYGWYFDGPSEEDLLCFYPGAKVEETAYAPLLHRLAEQGVDVCLVKMPFRFAFFGVEKAEKILAGYDHPNKYVGGHSLGGAMAANYASKHAEELSGVILLASYPTEDLDDGLILISIYGTEDGVLNTSRVKDGRRHAPERYTENVIEGGNHAQFGNYGEQKGDGKALVSREEQQEQTVNTILQAIRGAD